MELIITPPEKLKQLITECLADNRSNAPSTLAESKPQYIYSLKDLADLLGCSVLTAFKLKQSGKIRYQQFGRKLIFDAKLVMEDISAIGGIRKNNNKGEPYKDLTKKGKC